MSAEAKIPTSKDDPLALALDHIRRALSYPVSTQIKARGFEWHPMNEDRLQFLKDEVEAALRALAAPKPTEPTREAEPVAWMYEKRTENITRRRWQRSDARCSHLKGHGWTETPLYDAPALAAARAEGERAGDLSLWADGEDQWSAEIAAAHPMKTGRHDLYATALEMIRKRHSKYELVSLINWLLSRALPVPDPSPRPAEEVEAAVLAERGNYEAFSDFHDQQWMEAINYAADVELIETNAFIRAWREGSCEEHADPLGEWAAFRQWREAQRARTAPAKKVGRGCRSALSGVDNVSE